MKFGIFAAPYSMSYAAGDRSLSDVIAWDMQLVQWADRNGVAEAYFAEHHTVGVEPSPAPDLMIAAASQLTSQIRLGAAAHLLAYHHPIALAHRMIWLDHMTGGRYIPGVAPGSFKTDATLFATGKTNNDRMVEALDIIEAIMTKPAPFTIEGQFWTVDMPFADDGIHGQHLRPSQPLTMAMTGMQASSPTLTLAGSRGYLPMSQQVHADTLRKHWVTYETAAVAAGHEAKRTDWRIMRDFFVAETDEAAREAVLAGGARQAWEQYLLPVFDRLGLKSLLGGDDTDAADVDFEWMVDNLWLVGSPDTVIEKARALSDSVGGLGTVVSYTYDYSNDPDVYRRNFELLGEQVIPALADLVPSA